MSNGNKEAKKEELSMEDLEQVTGGWPAGNAIAVAQFASVAEGKPGDNAGFCSVR